MSKLNICDINGNVKSIDLDNIITNDDIKDFVKTDGIKDFVKINNSDASETTTYSSSKIENLLSNYLTLSSFTRINNTIFLKAGNIVLVFNPSENVTSPYKPATSRNCFIYGTAVVSYTPSSSGTTINENRALVITIGTDGNFTSSVSGNYDTVKSRAYPDVTAYSLD